MKVSVASLNVVFFSASGEAHARVADETVSAANQAGTKRSDKIASSTLPFAVEMQLANGIVVRVPEGIEMSRIEKLLAELENA
jgi:hypothetical protein